MKTVLYLLVFWGFFSSPMAKASNVGNQKIFRVRTISKMEDGRLGFKKLYATLACSESAVQLLTEPLEPNVINVGLLVQADDRPCDNPDREILTRYLPGHSELHPVDNFAEVWYCSAWCYQQNSPGYPYRVDAFGTSERQAYNNVTCGGWVTNVHCDIVPIAD